MNPPILQTKLYIPTPQSDLVPRPRLIDKLNHGLGRPLSLVCAPAGYGKTTLVTDWLATLGDASGREIAWLSLDEFDDDAGRYLAYVVAAIRTAVPDFGDGTTALLNSAQPQPPDLVIATLINELAALQSPLILVLDDFHVLTDPLIHGGLERMLPYLPPHVHLVITSRAEPEINLARLRARNQVNQVGVQDLRFTLAEAIDFINQRMGLTLSEAEVTELEARTEGWAAGLQLAALTLQNRPESQSTSDLIRSLSGSDRNLTDYLTHEIVLAQPEEIQRFLLSTSVLGRMCAELCDALTGSGDGHSILVKLERRNLFLIPLDNERRWYRYHHLFGELLQQMLLQQQGEEAILNLHQRASAWYEANAHLDSGYLDEAIEHALLAQQPEQAAAMLDDVVGDLLLNQGAFARVRQWMSQVPLESARDYPMTLIGGMTTHLVAHDVEGTMLYLEELRQKRDLPDMAVGAVAVVEANLLRMKGNVEEAQAYLRDALHTISEDDLTAGVLLRMQMASTLVDQEDLQGAYQLFAESAELAQISGDLYSRLMALRWSGGMLYRLGRLTQAQQVLEEALAIAIGHSGAHLPLAAEIYIGLAEVHFERNELDEANRLCTEGLRLAERSGIGDALMQAKFLGLELALASGDLETAQSVLAELKQMSQMVAHIADVAPQWDFYPVFETRYHLCMGEFERAAAVLKAQPVDLSELPSAVESYQSLYADAVVRQLWQEGQGAGGPSIQNHDGGWANAHAVEPLLAHLIPLADERELRARAIWLRSLEAIRLQTMEEPEQALSILTAALAAGEPEGYIRPFVDLGEPMKALLRLAHARKVMPAYVRTLLSAFESNSAAAPDEKVPQNASTSLVEPLTAREEEVLALVAAGLTNQQICDELIISIGTVKRHVANIFGKLGASHRAQAIALAKEFELLA